MYTYIHTHTQIHTHIHTHARTRTRTHTHTHTHTQNMGPCAFSVQRKTYFCASDDTAGVGGIGKGRYSQNSARHIIYLPYWATSSFWEISTFSKCARFLENFSWTISPTWKDELTCEVLFGMSWGFVLRFYLKWRADFKIMFCSSIWNDELISEKFSFTIDARAGWGYGAAVLCHSPEPQQQKGGDGSGAARCHCQHNGEFNGIYAALRAVGRDDAFAPWASAPRSQEA